MRCSSCFFFTPSTKIFSYLLRFVFFPGFKSMKPSIVCESCQTPLIPDSRHLLRQRFCRGASCQQARRREAQRRRRARFRDSVNATPKCIPLHQGWLNDEAALLKPHQVTLQRFHPAIIGLFSQLIDSPHPDDILAFLRRCIERGQDILFPPSAATGRRALQRKAKVNTGVRESRTET